MCAPIATRELRPVGVLVGGTGRPRAPQPPAPNVAVLLRPDPARHEPAAPEPLSRHGPAAA
jgi:hypothetical protein